MAKDAFLTYLDAIYIIPYNMTHIHKIIYVYMREVGTKFSNISNNNHHNNTARIPET